MPRGSLGRTNEANEATIAKNPIAFITIQNISVGVVAASPDAIGMRMATSASDAISSITAEVMIPVAACE